MLFAMRGGLCTVRCTILVLFIGLSRDFSAHAAAPPAPVSQTGQTSCYGTTGGSDCGRTGQDGETRTGVAWPEPRFTENSDQTIGDKLTGLAWTRDANPAERAKDLAGGARLRQDPQQREAPGPERLAPAERQ